MIVLVTGCRSGFGLLAAVELGRRGHTVYAGLRDLETAGPLREATAGLAVHPVQLDVTDGDQRDAAVARILAEQGRLDALVNNAGIAIGGFQEELEEAELRRLLEVNVVAVWALTKACLPHLRASRGHVCNISSVAGRIALPALGAYAASKHALEGLTESLRHELRPHGVRVTLVEPGPYKTDMLDRNRRVSAGTGAAHSPYAAQIRRTEQLEARIQAGLKDQAGDVAVKIADLVEATRPRLRHPMGASAWVRLFVRWLFPFALWEWLVWRVARPR